VKFLILLLFWSPVLRVDGRCYQTPVAGVVVESFVAPTCPYCVGHRGIEYATSPGSRVNAVAPGVATFVGVVVGVRYVIVAQADGLTATYGMLAAAAVREGDQISTGQTIAATSQSFYFGLRDNGRYIDPAPFLGSIVYRTRLVPIDSSRSRPAVPRGLACRVP
jgi:septal ring factor EnvC (AmiA/AmiB activator)